MTLSQARIYADTFAALLEPYIHRVTVAGSIRRKRPICNDIDLVVIPKTTAHLDMLGHLLVKENLLKNFLVQWIKETPYTSWKTGEAGASTFIITTKKCQIDIYCAAEETFGSVLLCRTGSADHNKYICTEAQKRDWKFSYNHGLLDSSGKVIASRHEDDIFAALDIDYITPEKRER